MIAEFVVSMTGKPSLNKTLAIASILGFGIRRKDALDHLKNTLGTGSRTGSGTGSHDTSGTGSQVVPEVVPEDVSEPVPGLVPKEKERSKEKETSLNLPPIAKAIVAPTGGRARQAVPEVEFEADDERRVAAILAVEASKNQGNSLAIGKVQSLRLQLRSVLDEIGFESWRYGLDEALSRTKPVAYAVAVAKSRSKAPKSVIPFSSRTFTDERAAEGSVAAAIAKATR